LPGRYGSLFLLHAERVPDHLSAAGGAAADGDDRRRELLPAAGLAGLAPLPSPHLLLALLLQSPAPQAPPLLPRRIPPPPPPPPLYALPPQPDEQPLHGGRAPQPVLVDRRRGAVLPALGAGDAEGPRAGAPALLDRARRLIHRLLPERLRPVRPDGDAEI